MYQVLPLINIAKSAQEISFSFQPNFQSHSFIIIHSLSHLTTTIIIQRGMFPRVTHAKFAVILIFPQHQRVLLLSIANLHGYAKLMWSISNSRSAPKICRVLFEFDSCLRRVTSWPLIFFFHGGRIFLSSDDFIKTTFFVFFSGTLSLSPFFSISYSGSLFRFPKKIAESQSPTKSLTTSRNFASSRKLSNCSNTFKFIVFDPFPY